MTRDQCLDREAKDRFNRESARASTSRGATETIEYGTFHARVGAVFGDGDGGGCLLYTSPSPRD